jgi:hypothetical protein
MRTGERQVAIRTADICEACAAGASASTVPFKACAACASKVITMEQALVIASELERDAAISLLLETPVGCDEMTCKICGGAPLADEPCGKCWACRVDKFLRDVGARK